MKNAHLTWDEVTKRADGQPVIVHYDGIQRSGYCDEEKMAKMFRDCELLQMTRNDYMVMKWPDKRSGN